MNPNDQNELASVLVEFAQVVKLLDGCFCDEYGLPECSACTANRARLEALRHRKRELISLGGKQR